MKFVYHHRIASKDGQYVHLDSIVNALRKGGHDVRLVGPRIVEQAEFGSDGGIFSRIRAAVPSWVGELLEVGYNAIALPRLVLAVAQQRPDAIYERYNLFSLAGVWTSRLTRRPLILEVNSPLAESRALYGRLRLERLARACERYVWRNADAVLPVTRVLAQRVADAGTDWERMIVIHNGCHESLLSDLSIAAQPSPFEGLDEPVILGFTGFLRSWHGLDTVLELLCQPEHSQTCFLVVGDGPARADLEQQARELGVADRLHITGTVAHEDMPSYVKLFDVALQPDVVEYASPLKMFDYMAMARAIVAPAKPNILELLTDGEDALLFEPGDFEDFKRAIARLLSDAELRAKLGQAAKRTALKRALTWESNAGRIVSIANNLLGGAGPKGPDAAQGD